MKGIVTSPHAVATRCGANLLAQGGNAIEAAIATVLSLCVTMPHFCGLGGDAFLLIGDAKGGVQAISGIGQAAAELGGYGSGAIPVRGPRSALTSAGAVDALHQAWLISRAERGGRRSWAELLAPAIALARDGFEITASERFWLDFRLRDAAELTGVFPAALHRGEVPPAGFIRPHNPLLTGTLETLAERGARDFYEGRLAARIAAGLREAGSPLGLADLGRTRARLEQPLAVRYRGGELLAHRPPTQGLTTLEIMGVLERFELAALPQGGADHYHLLVEAVKQAFIDRNRWLADPEHAEVPVAQLLSDSHLDRRAAAIRMDRALPWPQVHQHGDTVYVGAADAAGNSVSLLATIYYDWGSGVMAGDTGLLWHNRGAAFSPNPAHPNALAPGKRPFHTLNPGIYRRDGKVRLLYGTQGADGQPQTLAAVLTRLIDHRMDPPAALAAPRFLLGRTFSDSQDSLKLEEDVGPEVAAELRRRGHELALVGRRSPLMGQPGAIAIGEDGTLQGAHDPRSDGVAMTVAGC
ncbi:gamma-glutamyltransferase family protein [Paucibacter sp. R3-3]|uniref:Gamma-glutamyltransferase family protein n=1 Tax=Roseateles agri TaxID=3098619 RepID=A0ABU5DC04_9BURK|nr:gamma-glutamyltransferase family protein [Paucibacter sp. R3-3]MDY0743803.1 gamma-glutamyltransferase family protein [Paucibacter sp. R3-3]